MNVAPLVGGPPIRILLLTDFGRDVKRTIPIATRMATFGDTGTGSRTRAPRPRRMQQKSWARRT